jgi:hypothetical protein
MTGIRFSLASVLILFAVIGVAIVALNPPTQLKADLLKVATVCILLTALLAAINLSCSARPFWIGFALFGWFYFVVAFTAALPAIRHPIEGQLRTVRNAVWGTRVTAPMSQLGQPQSGFDVFYDHKAGQILTVPAWEYGFGEAAHCLVDLALAFAGGFIGRALAARGGRQTVGPTH